MSYYYLIIKIYFILYLNIGDWGLGLGIGDWGLGRARASM